MLHKDCRTAHLLNATLYDYIFSPFFAREEGKHTRRCLHKQVVQSTNKQRAY